LHHPVLELEEDDDDDDDDDKKKSFKETEDKI
jgi:hypothetical protein